MDIIRRKHQFNRGDKKTAQVNETIKTINPINHREIINKKTGYLK